MSLDIVRNKEIRGQILKILDLTNFSNLRDKIVLNALRDMGFNVAFTELIAQMKYLEQKEYIECRKLKDKIKNGMRVAKLTAKGKDLLEGNIEEDPGVTL